MYPFYYLVLLALVVSFAAIFVLQRLFLLPVLKKQEEEWAARMRKLEGESVHNFGEVVFMHMGMGSTPLLDTCDHVMSETNVHRLIGVVHTGADVKTFTAREFIDLKAESESDFHGIILEGLDEPFTTESVSFLDVERLVRKSTSGKPLLRN